MPGMTPLTESEWTCQAAHVYTLSPWPWISNYLGPHRALPLQSCGQSESDHPKTADPHCFVHSLHPVLTLQKVTQSSQHNKGDLNTIDGGRFRCPNTLERSTHMECLTVECCLTVAELFVPQHLSHDIRRKCLGMLRPNGMMSVILPYQMVSGH